MSRLLPLKRGGQPTANTLTLWRLDIWADCVDEGGVRGRGGGGRRSHCTLIRGCHCTCFTFRAYRSTNCPGAKTFATSGTSACRCGSHAAVYSFNTKVSLYRSSTSPGSPSFSPATQRYPVVCAEDARGAR